jgi:hypothetical protein
MYELTPTIHVYEREDWHARTPKPMDRQDPPREAFIHHGAETDRDAQAVGTIAEVLAAMRGIQNFHMDGRGWSDIGYHYVVFQPHGKLKHAVICEARLVHFVPAAQLGHNTGTFAVCVYGTIDSGDKLEDNTVWALSRLLSGVRAGMTGAASLRTVGGHRDVTQTECPGNLLYSSLPRIAADSHLAAFR